MCQAHMAAPFFAATGDTGTMRFGFQDLRLADSFHNLYTRCKTSETGTAPHTEPRIQRRKEC